jgi:hypothetical protein
MIKNVVKKSNDNFFGMKKVLTSCCRVVLVDRASQCTSSVFCFVGTGKIDLELTLQ